MRRFCLLGGALGAALWPAAAFAGPPFLTDDPGPTAAHSWEINSYAAGLRERGVTSGATGFDINYSPSDTVQANVVVPVLFGGGAPMAMGDVELALNLQLLRQDRGDPIHLRVFPRAILPTGRGSVRTRFQVPVWMERDFGPWRVFGGGGYTFPAGAAQAGYWYGGAAVSRDFAGGHSAGFEVFSQGAASTGARPLTVATAGGIVHLGGPFSLMGSVSRGVNRRATLFYSGIKAAW